MLGCNAMVVLRLVQAGTIRLTTPIGPLSAGAVLV